MNFKLLSFTFILLSIFTYQSFSSSESLLDADTKSLTDTGRTLNQAKLYTMKEEDFNTLFPYKYLDIFSSPSNLVGQIVDQNDEGRGTGLLYNIREEKGTLIGTCITAFHVFCRVGKEEGQSLRIQKDYKFVLNRKTTQMDTKRNIKRGEVKIEKVLFRMDGNPSGSPIKDICIFQGVLNKEPLVALSNERYIKEIFKEGNRVIIKNKEQIQELLTNVPSHPSKSLSCTIYHYPDGRKEMRRNQGDLTAPGLYKVRTLEGSSGAPLFINNEIIGVHIGARKLRKDVIAQYTPPSGFFDAWVGVPEPCEYTFALDDLHVYEYFSLEDYNELLHGINLYELTRDQKIILHIKLLYAMLEKQVEKPLVPLPLEEELPDIEELPIEELLNFTPNNFSEERNENEQSNL